MHQMCRKEGVLMPVNVNEIEPDEKIVEIEMERLREFRNHPFKVKADGQIRNRIPQILLLCLKDGRPRLHLSSNDLLIQFVQFLLPALLSPVFLIRDFGFCRGE